MLRLTHWETLREPSELLHAHATRELVQLLFDIFGHFSTQERRSSRHHGTIYTQEINMFWCLYKTNMYCQYIILYVNVFYEVWLFLIPITTNESVNSPESDCDCIKQISYDISERAHFPTFNKVTQQNYQFCACNSLCQKPNIRMQTILIWTVHQVSLRVSQVSQRVKWISAWLPVQFHLSQEALQLAISPACLCVLARESWLCI